LRFALGAIELELQVQAASEGVGEAAIKFWVVSVGGKGGRSSEATHTLRLSLTPVRVGAYGVRIVMCWSRRSLRSAASRSCGGGSRV
jgi:hypothetical protein